MFGFGTENVGFLHIKIYEFSQIFVLKDMKGFLLRQIPCHIECYNTIQVENFKSNYLKSQIPCEFVIYF